MNVKILRTKSFNVFAKMEIKQKFHRKEQTGVQFYRMSIVWEFVLCLIKNFAVLEPYLTSSWISESQTLGHLRLRSLFIFLDIRLDLNHFWLGPLRLNFSSCLIEIPLSTSIQGVFSPMFCTSAIFVPRNQGAKKKHLILLGKNVTHKISFWHIDQKMFACRTSETKYPVFLDIKS